MFGNGLKQGRGREARRVCCRRLFLLFLFLSACPLSAREAMTKLAFETKVEFYKISYPAFDYQAAKTEAVAKYPGYKPGDKVSVFDGERTVEGEFRQCSQGRVFIGGEVVLLRNIVKEDRFRFDPVLAENLRKMYVEKKFHQYSRKRWDDIAEYRRSLEKQYRIEGQVQGGSESKSREVGASAEAGDSSVSGPQESVPAVAGPLFGIVKNDILSSNGSVRAGEVIRDIRSTGFDRYSFVTADGRSASADAANIVMMEGIHDVRDAFLLTQRALALLGRNRSDEALFYARQAALTDPAQLRSEQIAAMIIGVNKAGSEIRIRNTEIVSIGSEIEHQLRLLARNQAEIKDEFAVKAGARDRSSVIGQKIFELREKQKVLQNEEKAVLETLLREGGAVVLKAAASGDFICACILLDSLERSFYPLANRVKVWRDEKEKQGPDEFFRRQQQLLVENYYRQISRPYQDRWSKSLDRYADGFGEAPADLEPFEVIPAYPNMLAAARTSTSDAIKYSAAIYSGNYSAVILFGLKMLVLMPGGSMAESCHRRIGQAWGQMEREVVRLKAVYTQHRLGRFIVECRRLNPLPLSLRLLRAEAENGVARADMLLKEAAAVAGKRDILKAQQLLQQSLALWPDNPGAEKFNRSFSSANRDFLYDAAALNLYRSQYRYRDAMEKCDLMYKQYPELRSAVRSMRAEIHRNMVAASEALSRAETDLQHGKFAEAQAIYEKYNDSDGLEKVRKARLDAVGTRK